MADSRVACEVVTQFLLNTCQRRERWNVESVQSMMHCYTVAANIRERPSDDVEFAYIPLTTGSVAELYIRPMYSCVGDIDIMAYDNDMLAIPAGYPPPRRLPEEFHSRVEVCEIIDSEYPGYVYLMSSYLLTGCMDDEMYNAVNCPRRYKFFKRSADEQDHGPAFVLALSLSDVHRFGRSVSSTDYVQCMRCLSWPPQAAAWPIRHRNYNWPDSATVDRVVSNGCDVVHVAHCLCRDNVLERKYQFRLSFSRAEVVLLNSWTRVQQTVYHMMRVFTKIESFAYATQQSQLSESRTFSNYNIKTLLLWACELKPKSWWTDDLNLVRLCVELMHTLAIWLTDSHCSHYFINKCNLFEHHGQNSYCVQLTAGRLLSVTESSLADWFVDVYVRKCTQRCPARVSQLFDDVSTSARLHNAVSAVVKWRLSESFDVSMYALTAAQYTITHDVSVSALNVQSCVNWMRQLPDIDQRLRVYLTALVFLHVAFKMRSDSLNDELLAILATTCLQSNGARRCFQARHSSELSLSQAVKLMKGVVENSRNTVQLIEIELSKAYLHRALRCKDSYNDSIYCLVNAYLAVLYYTTGQYQTAIDHCTLVTRSQDHSQCSSHVVQGELLPKIGDDIDNVLGVTVFYQYVRVAALNHQQKQVGVFSTELFASYLHIRCLSVTECRPFRQTSAAVRQYHVSLREHREMFTADVLLCRLISRRVRAPRDDRQVDRSRTPPVESFSTLKLEGLLQQSAVEHLTTYRQLEARWFGRQCVIVTTDFESLYAYKRGDYQRCLQLSTHNVHSLIGRRAMSFAFVLAYPEFIQLMDDEIASLTGLTLLVQPSYRESDNIGDVSISQLSLSLYLMTLCQMKLHHPVTSLGQTLHYIEVNRRIHSPYQLERLTMKLAERKLLRYISVHC